MIIRHLSKRSGFNYRPKARGNQQYVHPCHLGYGMDRCLDVIDWCAKKWGNKREFRTYLSPKTLFGSENFAGYAEEVEAQTAESHPPCPRLES